MRMKKQLRKMSSSSIMHHPQAAIGGVETSTATGSVRDRRASTNSESSVDPMEISHQTTTSASDANNSSLQVSKVHHSSEEEDDQNNNIHHNNDPLKKLYIKSRRGLVNGNSGRRSDGDADAEEDEKEQYTSSWGRGANSTTTTTNDKEQTGNYLTILRKKGRYSNSRVGGGNGPAEEKWNGKDDFEAAIQHQTNASPSDVTCRICSKVGDRFISSASRQEFWRAPESTDLVTKCRADDN